MSTSVASVTSHFPDAENGFTTTLASTIASGAATVPLNSVAGYTNGQPAVFIVDPTDTSKKQTFTGIIDTGGVQVTSAVWTAGTNQTHTAGATVVDYATATHIAMISKGLQVSHNQDGTMITSLPLTTPKITTSINDTNSNELFKVTATASATNEFTVANAANGSGPTLSTTGSSDSNVDFNISMKGTGVFKVGGNTIQHGAWTSWTPTLANASVGNGTLACKYVVEGKTVHFRFQFNLGTTSTVGTAPTFTLPLTSVTVPDVDMPIAFGQINNGAGSFNAFSKWTTTTTSKLLYWDTNNNESGVTATAPGTFGNGYKILLNGTYEIA